MKTAGMGVGDVGVGAFDPPGEVGTDEQVEDPVDAVGRDPAPLRLRDRVGDVIGAGRAGEPCERIEHGRTHIRPLLAGIDQPLAGGGSKRLPGMHMVVVARHDLEIGSCGVRHKRRTTKG